MRDQLHGVDPGELFPEQREQSPCEVAARCGPGTTCRVGPILRIHRPMPCLTARYAPPGGDKARLRPRARSLLWRLNVRITLAEFSLCLSSRGCTIGAFGDQLSDPPIDPPLTKFAFDLRSDSRVLLGLLRLLEQVTTATADHEDCRSAKKEQRLQLHISEPMNVERHAGDRE